MVDIHTPGAGRDGKLAGRQCREIDRRLGLGIGPVLAPIEFDAIPAGGQQECFGASEIKTR